MDEVKKKKRVAVLVGGGGCGLVSAAAADELHKAGLLDDVVLYVGTSVGGLNACVLAVGMAMGKGTDLLMEAWARIKSNADVYTPDLAAAVEHPWAHPIDDALMTDDFFRGPGACKVSPLVAMVQDILGGWSTERLAAAGAPQVLTRAVSPDGMRAQTLQGDLVVMALGTSAIPGVFPPQWGRTDGGAVDNEPIDVALAQGAEEIIVLFCGPEDPPTTATDDPITVRVTDPAPPAVTGFQNVLRELQGLTARGESLADQAAAKAEAAGIQVLYVYPRADTGSALQFEPGNREALGREAGRLAVADARALGWLPALPVASPDPAPPAAG